MQLTVFYDGRCPLCLAEMRQLSAHNTEGRVVLEDLHAPGFVERFPHIDPVRAQNLLHGELDSGEILLGLDVTCTAWSLVGRHRWLAVLRWPLIRPVADRVYLWFARHRHRISRLVTGKQRCETCVLNDAAVTNKE